MFFLSDSLYTVYIRVTHTCKSAYICTNKVVDAAHISDCGEPTDPLVKEYYCFYTFRHTWATIAQNDCDANLYEVAFGMNHSQGLNVTRGYVKLDFTPAWELNAKVFDFIFYSDKKSKQGKARSLDAPAEKLFRLSRKMMVYGRAYFKGKGF